MTTPATEPWRLTATGALARIDAGDLDPESWMRARLGRALTVKPAIRAFTEIAPEMALRRARESMKRPGQGMLRWGSRRGQGHDRRARHDDDDQFADPPRRLAPAIDALRLAKHFPAP